MQGALNFMQTPGVLAFLHLLAAAVLQLVLASWQLVDQPKISAKAVKGSLVQSTLNGVQVGEVKSSSKTSSSTTRCNNSKDNSSSNNISSGRQQHHASGCKAVNMTSSCAYQPQQQWQQQQQQQEHQQRYHRSWHATCNPFMRQGRLAQVAAVQLMSHWSDGHAEAAHVLRASCKQLG
jgi:hypothetical protein